MVNVKNHVQNRGESGQIGVEIDPDSLTFERMPGESSRQYSTWLLYFRVGSLKKVLEIWDKVLEIESIANLAPKIGKKPAESTIDLWSSKFHWVQRYDQQFKKHLAEMSEETKRIALERKDRVAQFYKIASEKKVKQISQGERISDNLYKYSWEMLRTELDLSTGTFNHNIKEEDQRPPTPEELEFDKFIGDQTIKFIEAKKNAQSREQHNLLDS